MEKSAYAKSFLQKKLRSFEIKPLINTLATNKKKNLNQSGETFRSRFAIAKTIAILILAILNKQCNIKPCF